MRLADRVAELVRRDGPRLVSALASRSRDIELAEECVQDAFVAALSRWSEDGVPERPTAWLYAVARNRQRDRLRRRREIPEGEEVEAVAAPPRDDRLGLLFACCHPAVEPRNQVGLALRTLCGLSTEEVARAFLESPEVTSRRLVRASRKIRDLGIPFEVPAPGHRAARVTTVASSIYLLFNEGYAPTRSAQGIRPELCALALTLGQEVARLMPREPELLGLVALMQLHHARRDGRVDAEGALVVLSRQDRSRWHHDEIAEGIRGLERAMAWLRPGPYQLQAAIAALHAEAPSAEETDWTQITALYSALLRRVPSPVVELNAAVALAMSRGPAEALARVEKLERDGRLVEHHPLHAVRGDLLVRLGRREEGAAAFRRAAALCASPMERRHLEGRARDALERRRRRRAVREDARTTLTEREWARLRPLFPERSGPGRPGRSDRELVEAVVWVLSSGAPWRALPARFGPWQTAYHRFRLWEQDGRMSEIGHRLGRRVPVPVPLRE